MHHSVDLSGIMHHITQLETKIPLLRERQLIEAILLELCIPTKQPGFEYLCRGIMLYRKDPSQMITKELYPTIAKGCRRHVEPLSVERAIRAAIAVGFAVADNPHWQLYFPGLTQRPSNADLISRLSRLLDLSHLPQPE